MTNQIIRTAVERMAEEERQMAAVLAKIDYAIVQVSLRRYRIMQRLSRGQHRLSPNGQVCRAEDRVMHAIEMWVAKSKPLNWSDAVLEYARLCPQAQMPEAETETV